MKKGVLIYTSLVFVVNTDIVDKQFDQLIVKI